MLSYQHEYHAGNHADVLKHAVLSLVVKALQRKEKPLRVFDSHAGSGVYDLRSREARRNAEFEEGIGRVLAAASPPPELDAYLGAVRSLNPGGELRIYPGSPGIVVELMRPQDHLVLMELHPQATGALRRNFGGRRQVHVHARDCFEGLPALLPPPERRGLVLVDPSYEVKADFVAVAELLSKCHERWPGGTYLVWYPLIRDRAADRFSARVAGLGIRKIYHLSLEVQDSGCEQMRGSGLLLVNPPFGLEPAFASLMPWLWNVLAPEHRGGWQAGWLVPE